MFNTGKKEYLGPIFLSRLFELSSKIVCIWKISVQGNELKCIEN